jgi:DNA polymerase-1
VTKTLSDFEQVIFADFEFVPKPGERPDVVCLAWHEWPSGQTYCLWQDHLGDSPPYRIDDKVLFVCFVANAELCCHLALNWPLPANVIDLSAEFRCITNGRVVPQGKGLLGALAYFGIDNIGSKRKDAMRARIMKGWPFTPEERAEILLYVASDAEPLALLLRKMLPYINLDIALHRGEFVACLALMEHRGVPIDMENFSATCGQTHVECHSRCDGAGDRHRLWRLRQGRRW